MSGMGKWGEGKPIVRGKGVRTSTFQAHGHPEERGYRIVNDMREEDLKLNSD